MRKVEDKSALCTCSAGFKIKYEGILQHGAQCEICPKAGTEINTSHMILFIGTNPSRGIDIGLHRRFLSYLIMGKWCENDTPSSLAFWWRA